MKTSTLLKGYLIILGGVSLLKLHLGFYTTDELQFVVSSALEALGGMPFVHESYIQQIASLYFSWAVRLYFSMFDSFDGVVLFFRYLYFFLMLGVAGLGFWCFSKFSKDQLAVAISCSVLGVYIYMALPTVSYNTIGMLGITASYFLAFVSLKVKNKSLFLFLSGIVASFAFFAHMGMAVAITLLPLFIWHFNRNLRSVFMYASGGVITSAAIILWLYSFGWENIQESYKFSALFNVGGSFEEKFSWIRFHYHRYSYLNYILPLVIATIALFRKIDPLYFVVTGAVALICLQKDFDPPTQTQILMSLLPFSMLLIALFRDKLKITQTPSLFLALILFLSSLPLAWVSSATIHAAGILGQVALVFCSYVLLSQQPSRASVFIVLFLAISFDYGTTHWGDFPDKQVRRFQSTAMKGIWTNQDRINVVESLQTDLKALETEHKTLQVYTYNIGYLLSSLKPHTRTTLIHGLEKPGVIQNHHEFFVKYGPPDVFVEMIRFPIRDGRVDDISKDVRGRALAVYKDMLGSHAQYTARFSRYHYIIWTRVR